MVQALQREGPEEGGGAEVAGGQGRGLAGEDPQGVGADGERRAGDLERAADFSREPNVHLGPVRYRTIRGGASETVQQAGRRRTENRWSGWSARLPGSRRG